MSSTHGRRTEDELPAELIRGRYRLDERLAQGGMGTVYRGTDTTLNRPVAVKLLHATADGSEDHQQLVTRFRREAESLARLNQRNIVTIYDYGETGKGGYFLAMEFVDGPSLAKIAKAEHVDPQRTIRLVIQVARALSYAHRHGIIHRDIKPGNILVARTEDGEVAKLVDFGLVRLQQDERLTAHGLILGSVHCMAPEQIRGAEVDPRTDIYALGVVTFRLLTGEYPFHSSQPTEVMAAHLHAPIPHFRDIQPGLVVPPGLEGIVRKCLAKNPDERYQNAGELINDLKECLEVPPSEFISVTLVEDVTKVVERGSGRRKTLLLGVAAVGLLGMLGGVTLIGASLLLQQPDERAAQLVEPAPTEPKAVAQPEPDAQPEPNAQPEPEAVAQPEPEPEPEPAPVARPGPAPAPVAAPAPRPAPRARPAPSPAPEPVVAAAPEQPEPAPAAEPAFAVLLQDVAVSAGESEVVVRLTLSNTSVRPFHFAAEGVDPTYPKRYQISFRGGGSAYGRSTIPVGSPLVENVSIVQANGALAVLVNSKARPQMRFSGAGPEYVLTVTP